MWKPDLPQKFLITRTKAIRDGPWGSSWVENHWTPVQKCGTVMTTHSNSYNLLVLFNYSKRGWTCLWHPKFFLKCRELPSSSQPWHQPQVLRLMDIILEGVDLPYMAKKNNTYLDIRHPRSMKIYSTGVDTAWKATKNKILFDTICATPQIFPTNHHTPKYFKGVETAPQTSRIEN